MPLDSELLEIRMRLKDGREVVAGIKDVRQETDKLGRSTGRTVAPATRAERANGRLANSFRQIGAGVKWAGIGLGIFAAFEIPRVISAYRESYKVGRQTNAVIKSTGGVANVTASYLEDLAGTISRKTGIDDEELQSAGNLLLTYKEIRNEVGKNNKIYDEALRLSIDLAKATGGDFNGAIKQVGKALNDPTKGLTALTRSGVSFNAQQQETIKGLWESGERLRAQKMILRELDTEFAGSAIAQGDPFDKMSVAIENVEEAMGSALFPVFSSVADEAAKQFGRIEKILSSDKLTDDQKFDRIADIISDSLEKGIDKAVELSPRVFEIGGRLGLKLAGGLARGFWNAPILGKLFVGGLLLAKMGGLGPLAKLGARGGWRLGTAMGTRFLAAVAPSLAADIAGAGIGAVLHDASGPLRRVFGRVGGTLGATMGARIVAALSLPTLLISIAFLIPEKTRASFLHAGNEIGRSIMDGIKQSISDVSNSINLNVGGRGGEVLRDAVGGILDAVSSVRPTGDVGGHIGGMVTKNGIRGYNRGGPVSSRLHPNDRVPAMLEDGEFVMRKRAVDFYGSGFMRSLNKGRFNPGQISMPSMGKVVVRNFNKLVLPDGTVLAESVTESIEDAGAFA